MKKKKIAPPPPKAWAEIDPEHRVIVVGHLWELLDQYRKMWTEARSSRHPQPELANLYHLVEVTVLCAIRLLTETDNSLWDVWENQAPFRREIVYSMLLQRFGDYLHTRKTQYDLALPALSDRSHDSAEALVAAVKFLGWKDHEEVAVEKTWGILSMLADYMSSVEFLHYKR